MPPEGGCCFCSMNDNLLHQKVARHPRHELRTLYIVTAPFAKTLTWFRGCSLSGLSVHRSSSRGTSWHNLTDLYF